MILEGRAQGKSNLGGEMLDGETKLMKQANRNKLKRISRSYLKVTRRWSSIKLLDISTKGYWRDCFHKLDGRKAVGIDRKTKSEYGQNLKANTKDLVARMKTMSYRPVVREVQIPKPDVGKKTAGD